MTAAVRTAHQTASPSKVFAEIGRDDIAGLIMGLEEGKYTLAEVIKALDPTKALKHLITTAEQYAKSVVSAAESGASLSSLWGQTQAGQMAAGMAPPVYGNIADAMKASIKQIKEFDADIKRLKREGLSKNLIEQLLQEGPAAGLAQAQSILGGGKGYIAQLDNLERQIQKYSDQLGKTAVSDKYGAQIGQDVAQGMAPGWHAVVAAIKSQTIRVEVHVDAPVTVDGKKLARVTQTYTLQHAARNSRQRAEARQPRHLTAPFHPSSRQESSMQPAHDQQPPAADQAPDVPVVTGSGGLTIRKPGVQNGDSTDGE